MASALFSAVFNASGSGIGHYDLRSRFDRAFAFDYDHSGKLDHLALYRPGTGTIWILKHENGNFQHVYQEGDPGRGIGLYDLRSHADRVFAFDYDHSGKLDHLVLYRPGTGTIWILKHENDNFQHVYQEGDPGRGIASCDLKSKDDQAFAFDFDHSGKLDHLVLYRPGTGKIWILKNNDGEFETVYPAVDSDKGIGVCDLRSPADRVLAFDYDHSGKLDHLVVYRPGEGNIWILRHDDGDFQLVYHKDTGNWVGDYDLMSSSDIAFAFDCEHSGKLDYLALYRPGSGNVSILKHTGGIFHPVYPHGDLGKGIGGYPLDSGADRVFAFDYDHSGNPDHLVLYRPGVGMISILRSQLVTL